MSDKNAQERLKLVESIVWDFYNKAGQDFLIGHQFRKIATAQGLHPLQPPMEAFAEHLPKIEKFWKIQLQLPLGPEDHGVEMGDLFRVHLNLHLKRGELGRWMVLFHEVLQSYRTRDPEFIERWEAKLAHFQQVFLNHPQLFSSGSSS